MPPPAVPLVKASSLPADCSDHIRSLRIYALSAVTSSSSPAASSAASSSAAASFSSSSSTSSPAEAFPADGNTTASSLITSSPMAPSAIPSYADAPTFPAASPLVGLPHSALFPVSRDSSRQSSLDSQSQACHASREAWQWKQPTFQRTNQRLLFWEAARNGESSQSLRTTLLRTQSCAVLANAGASASASAVASSSSPRSGSAAVPFPVSSSGVVARSTSSGNELADVATAVTRRGERTRRLSSGVVEAAQRVTAGREGAGGVTTGCSSTSSGGSVGSTCSSSTPSAGNSGSNSPRICFPVAPLRTSSCPVEDNTTNGDRIDVDNPVRSQSQSHVHSYSNSHSLGNSPGAATSRPVWRTASIESGNPLPTSPLARVVPDESVFHWAARTRIARARMASVPST